MSKEIIQSLLLNCHFAQGMMMTGLKGEQLVEAYNLFRVAVLDGEIPLSKAVGFKLFSSTQMEDLAVIDRHTSCLENMVELSKNVSKVIFVDETGFIVSSKEKVGNVYSSNAGFSSNGLNTKVLDGDCYLYNSTEPLGIRLFVCENTGYASMEENVALMKNIYGGNEESSTYFPLNTDHSLMEYVRVLPFDGKAIRYRLRKGFTDEALSVLWKRYLERRNG